jgi:hypothetical protein
MGRERWCTAAIWPEQVIGNDSSREDCGHFLRFSFVAGVSKRAANSSVEADAVEWDQTLANLANSAML